MVDTAVFSIFHRAPPRAVPPEPVAAPAVPAIVEHPLLSIPAVARHEEPSPEPTAPEPVPPPVAEAAAPVHEPVEATVDHPEIPPEPAAPVHHEPAEASVVDPEIPVEKPAPAHDEPVVATADHPEIPVEAAVPVHYEPAAAALPEPEPSVEDEVEQIHVHEVAAAPAEATMMEPELEEPELEEPELEEPEFTDEFVVLAEPEPEPHYETAAEVAYEEESEPVVAWLDTLHTPEAPVAHDLAFDHLVESDSVVEIPEPLPETVDYAPIDPPPPHWADRVDAPPDSAAEPPWHGPAQLANIPVDADQLGLANPIVITLLARLKDSSAVELDASQSGIYRPQTFRAAPWSGFAYDQAQDGRTGLAAGTRILTSRGEMEVEKLLPGDTAMTLRAPALVPIAWIGKSVATAAPIWIEAGALGPNLPRRGLCIAPDQPVYVEPIPVPAARLVNGTTIRVVDSEDVDLFHVDVGKSEILFAEGLPLSSGDRNRLQRA